MQHRIDCKCSPAAAAALSIIIFAYPDLVVRQIGLQTTTEWLSGQNPMNQLNLNFTSPQVYHTSQADKAYSY